MGFLEELRLQRWDDHRFYHQSVINQALHFVSACTFLASYVLLFENPVAAALVGWLIAMISRQAGHFFFEPHDYDDINQASHDHKEDIKIGYNLRRKVVLLSIWALSPLLLYVSPTLFGIFEPHADWKGFVDNMSAMWLAIALGALLFRTVQLFFIRSPQTGLVWLAKIFTDPIHDLKMYHRAPLRLMRGELLDPINPQLRH